MSKKTPNHKALQRITALEREVRRLRAGIRKDILSAAHHEVKIAFKEQDKDRVSAIGFRTDFHGLGPDHYSEDDDD